MELKIIKAATYEHKYMDAAPMLTPNLASAERRALRPFGIYIAHLLAAYVPEDYIKPSLRHYSRFENVEALRLTVHLTMSKPISARTIAHAELPIAFLCQGTDAIFTGTWRVAQAPQYAVLVDEVQAWLKKYNQKQTAFVAL